MSKIVNWFTSAALTVCFGVEQLATVLVAMIPMIELKGAIPVGVKLGLGYFESFGWSFLGSSLVCIPLYWLFKWLFHFKFFKRIETVVRGKAASLFKKTAKLEEENANKKRITFLKWLGVFIFVAIPVPLTGVWTGTLVAVLIGLDFKWSVPAVVAGNAVSGGIILLLTWLLGDYLDWFILALFAVVVVLFIVFLYKLFKTSEVKHENN